MGEVEVSRPSEVFNPHVYYRLQVLYHGKPDRGIIFLSFFFKLLRNLKPVTQLYVSVDASTKESLKKIDRPLFKDFWQRFLDSLKALAAKVRIMTS